MADEAAAVGTGRVSFRRILGLRASKNGLPIPAGREPVSVIDGVAALMTQQHLAPFSGAAFDFEHLPEFQRFETGMRQIERDGDGGGAFRREPFVTQITIGAKSYA